MRPTGPMELETAAEATAAPRRGPVGGAGRGRRALSLALFGAALLAAPGRGWAGRGDDDDDEAEEADADRAPARPAPAKAKAKAPAKPRGKAPARAADEDDEASDEEGGDGGDDRGADADPGDEDGADAGGDGGDDRRRRPAANDLGKDRFFIDKLDTAKTSRGTLVQGSLTSTSLYYGESGGAFAGAMSTQGSNASKFSRMFTDLRSQVDFRHLGGGAWDARLDARARLVAEPGVSSANFTPAEPNRIQSGLIGQDEYEVKELYAVRTGRQNDVFVGRQIVADLAAVKIDGIRVDHASSPRFTLLGFAGAYPVRGSRSLATDYPVLRSNQGASLGRTPPVAGGFGAAYRTAATYGALGGVAIVPLKGERPRVFATSNGYWRSSPTLDFYHFAVVDLFGSAGLALTNGSAGLNYKPNPRMRITGSVNHVDTETLNVQANSFLGQPDAGVSLVQNEVQIRRIATSQARGALSVGLGPLQRFEITVAGALRYRPDVALAPPGGTAMTAVSLPAAKGVEIYGGFVDRRSVRGFRLGADASRTFGVGSTAFQRSEALAVRVLAERELAGGRGEVDAELGYASHRDAAASTACTDLSACFGSSSGATLSLGGTGYYRLGRDWFAVGSLFLARSSNKHGTGAMAASDPGITGVTGFARLAYRF